MKGYLINQKQEQVYFMLIDNMLYAMQDENAASASCLNIEYSQLYLPRCSSDEPRGLGSKPRPSNTSLEIRSPDGSSLVLQAQARLQAKLWEKALSRQMMRSDFQKRFRPLRRLKSLSSGGELLECLSIKSGKSYCIKVFSRHLLDQDPVKRDAVYREISMLRKLTHPNTSNLIESHQTDRSICLIFELLDCETLQEVLQKNKRLSRSDIVSIVKGLLQGLEHLQSKGVSHNMITPSNILLKKTSKHYSPEDVIIADFKKATYSANNHQHRSGEQDLSLDLWSHDEAALQNLKSFMHTSSIDRISCKSVMSLKSAENLIPSNNHQRSRCLDAFQIGQCIYAMLSCGQADVDLSGEKAQSKQVTSLSQTALSPHHSLQKKSKLIGRKKDVDSQLLGVADGLVAASECGLAAIQAALSDPLFRSRGKADESEVQDQANEFRPRERIQFNLRLKSIPSVERKPSPFIKFKRGVGSFDTAHSTNKHSTESRLDSSCLKKASPAGPQIKIEQPLQSPAQTTSKSNPRRLSFDFSKAILLRLCQSSTLKKADTSSAIQKKLGRLSSFGRQIDRSTNFELLL